MIALYLIAAHLVGDFVLQNRWQAADKLTSRRARADHVFFYCVPFVPILMWRFWSHPAVEDQGWRALAFLAALYALHFATDSQRFYSTLGDVVQWRIDFWRDPLVIKQEWLSYVVQNAGHGPRAADVSDEAVRWPTPNPWPAIPLMIDQTLHLCQLALLGGLLLA